jgi:NAD(P)H-flavin reductase
LVNGGPVSAALALAAQPGDRLRLGPPFGRMTLDPESSRPVLLVAGSTGLAPMKAIIGQIAAAGPRPTHLYFGARSAREVYDEAGLRALEQQHDWLTVVTAVSHDYAGWEGATGLVGEVAAGAADWSGHDVFVCGSPPMVEATVKLLVAGGVPDKQIKFEEFGEG